MPFSRVEERVRPDRARNPNKRRREIWWQFTGLVPELTRAIGELGEVLVIARVSKSLMPARVSASQVFSNTLYVFANDSYAFQAILSSTLHQLWAIKYGTTMRVDPTYAISDIFETFPLPDGSGDLDDIGIELDRTRREIMLRRNLGLTKLYNIVNDPAMADDLDADLARMRRLHVQLDEVVMGAYGWSDVELDPGFHTYRQMERWTVSPAARVEILDRLLEENQRQAAAEAAQSKAPRKSRNARVASNGMEGMFS